MGQNGGDADGVQDAADALVARLREQPELFGPVFDPAADPFLRRNGLLYLEVAELETLSNRLAEAQPLLGTLWRSPDLAGLASVLGQAVEQIQDEGEAPLEIARALGSVAEVVEAQTAGRPGRLSWQDLMAGAAAEAPGRRLVLVQPVTEYDLPALERVRVRSAIPGRVAIGTC